MDFDNILDIATQNQGIGSGQVSERLSFALYLLRLNIKMRICG